MSKSRKVTEKQLVELLAVSTLKERARTDARIETRVTAIIDVLMEATEQLHALIRDHRLEAEERLKQIEARIAQEGEDLTHAVANARRRANGAASEPRPGD